MLEAQTVPEALAPRAVKSAASVDTSLDMSFHRSVALHQFDDASASNHAARPVEVHHSQRVNRNSTPVVKSSPDPSDRGCGQ